MGYDGQMYDGQEDRLLVSKTGNGSCVSLDICAASGWVPVFESPRFHLGMVGALVGDFSHAYPTAEFLFVVFQVGRSNFAGRISEGHQNWVKIPLV